MPPNGHQAMPSSSINPPPSAFYDASAPSGYMIPNGLPLARPLSDESTYSPSGSYSEVLPNSYQTYSPDPYSSIKHSRASSITNASSASHPPTANASISPSALSKPASSIYSPVQPRPRLQQSRKGPPPPLHDPVPAYSSSHTFTYPEAYPSRSVSGSSASTVAASPASPPSTGGSLSSTSQPSHAAVVAANNRIRLANISAASSSAAGSSNPRKPVAKKASTSTRHALELAFDCRFCGVPLAKLTLRGGGSTTSGRHEGVYYCTSCVPLPTPPPPQHSHLSHDEEEASYADTLSAAVDRLEGISVEESDPRPPPANRHSGGGQSLSGSTNKKRTKSDEESTFTIFAFANALVRLKLTYLLSVLQLFNAMYASARSPRAHCAWLVDSKASSSSALSRSFALIVRAGIFVVRIAGVVEVLEGEFLRFLAVYTVSILEVAPEANHAELTRFPSSLRAELDVGEPKSCSRKVAGHVK